MTKRLWMLMVAFALCTAPMACGDDGESDGNGDGDEGGDGDGDATTGDGDGDGDGAGDEWGELNLDCPDTVGPLEGPGGQRGECCYRNKPNSVKRAEFDAMLENPGDMGMLSLGFRFNHNSSLHPAATLAVEPLPSLAKSRAENYEQQLMVRFTFPRGMNDAGDIVDMPGDGFFEVGAGTYDCDDGTFMFYGDGPAPVIPDAVYPGADSTDRWRYTKLPATVDPSISGADRFEVSFEDRQSAGFSYTSYVEPSTFNLDWEIVTQGFDIVEFEWDEENVDCLGSRDGNTWDAKGIFEVYADMKNNNDPNNGIMTVGGINFCTLVSFGVGASADPDNIPNCEEEPRCMPGSDGCRWLALPNALCPETEEERAIFGCHFGDESNVNGDDTAVLNCTADAPTEYDPDSDGQCCDPLGTEESGLPACNAFRLVNEFVAASAVIKDELADTALEKCPAP